MHFVYIVECKDASLYTGYTNDLHRRVHTHNHGTTGAKYTRARRPVVLRYSERFRSRSKALRREAEVKKLTRQQKLHLIRFGDGL